MLAPRRSGRPSTGWRTNSATPGEPHWTALLVTDHKIGTTRLRWLSTGPVEASLAVARPYEFAGF